MEGIFGIISENNCLGSLYDGTFRLQHRGQSYCGLSTSDGEQIKIRTHRGLVGATFENDLPGLEGCLGVGYTGSQVRQPISHYGRRGEFMLAFNGRITNAESLRKELLAQGHSFVTLADVELLATLIAQGEDIFTGTKAALSEIRGPCSLVLLTKDGVYAARDRLGFRPLVLGKGKDKDERMEWVVASESCAFGNNIERVREIEPGEVVFLGRGTNPKSVKIGCPQKKHCSFEWIYYARPDSVIEGVSVVEVRHNLGAFLAQEESIKVDAVGPIPFSGILHAEGYHLASKVPSVEIFLLPQYIKRTYIMPLEERKNEKRKKLTPLTENVRGRRIAVVDDSIRSGITMRGLVGLLKEAGASEVHVRVASPLSIRYCPYDVPPREEEEFIASRKNLAEIREFLGADSLMFQRLENVPKAIGIPSDNLCLDCFLK